MKIAKNVEMIAKVTMVVDQVKVKEMVKAKAKAKELVV